MSFEKPGGSRPMRPRFGKNRPNTSPNSVTTRPETRMNGSAQQKQTQWLSRATDAERAGDAVEAELCRQYAEHWFRVSRGQD